MTGPCTGNKKPAVVDADLPETLKNCDYITDLPDVEGMNSVMTVRDEASRMTQFIACSKSVTAAQSPRLYMKEASKLHVIRYILY